MEFQNYNKKEASLKNCKLALHNILQLSKVENYKILETPIDEENFVLTSILGDEQKPKLVLIHGYGSAQGFFFQILNQLCQHYQVYMMDLLGMGGSSRPDFCLHQPSDCIHFFVSSIETWRNYHNLIKFYLCGHSFGGYISGLYSVQYPHYIQKLILISPVGLSILPQNFHTQNEFFFHEKQVPKLVVMFQKYMWKKEISAIELGRKFPYFLINRIIKSKMKLKEEQNSEFNRQLLSDYKYQILFNKQSSESSLFKLFNHALFAHISLGQKDQLNSPNFPLPVIVIYGNRDWVYKLDKNAGLNVVQNSIWQESRVEIIHDSNHNIVCDQGDKLANLIISILYQTKNIKYNNHNQNPQIQSNS